MPERARGERWSRADRLLRSEDFRRCYRRGRRQRGRLFDLLVTDNELARPRLGMTASRKVGGAVARQRMRRRVREVFRRCPDRERLGGRDLVVHFKPPAATANFDEIKQEMCKAVGVLLRRRRR